LGGVGAAGQRVPFGCVGGEDGDLWCGKVLQFEGRSGCAACTFVRVGEGVARGQHKEDDDEEHPDEKVLAGVGAVKVEDLNDTVTRHALCVAASVQGGQRRASALENED
jgi:hypothetical protein